MAKQVEFVFNVKGRGAFPFDMLRYDRCWPNVSSDSPLIAMRNSREDRVITLRSTREPTTGRWLSYGWEVISVEKRNLT